MNHRQQSAKNNWRDGGGDEREAGTNFHDEPRQSRALTWRNDKPPSIGRQPIMRSRRKEAAAVLIGDKWPQARGNESISRLESNIWYAAAENKMQTSWHEANAAYVVRLERGSAEPSIGRCRPWRHREHGRSVAASKLAPRRREISLALRAQSSDDATGVSVALAGGEESRGAGRGRSAERCR